MTNDELIQIRIPKELKKRLKKASKKCGMSAFIKLAIEAELKKCGL